MGNIETIPKICCEKATVLFKLHVAYWTALLSLHVCVCEGILLVSCTATSECSLQTVLQWIIVTCVLCIISKQNRNEHSGIMYVNSGAENVSMSLNFMGRKLRNHTVAPAAKQRK